MFELKKINLPQLGFRGLEADLTEEEQAIQQVAHRFAEEVMHDRDGSQTGFDLF
jgi:hypothetical protein